VSSESTPLRTIDLAARLKEILGSRGYTLHQVSRIAENLYGKHSPFCLPHNLYHELGLRTFTPSLHQIYALSRITNYKLADWLFVFGFDLSEITRLEVLLSSKHTVLLDPSLDDLNCWIPWFEGKAFKVPLPAIAPMTRLLDYSLPRRVADLSDINSRNFLYARLGRLDLFAFPYLLPGSIIRVNPSWQQLPPISRKISDQFFLIEHSRGLCCCRLEAGRANTLIPISTQLPYAHIELRIPDEVRVLGLVDAEIRPVPILESAEVLSSMSKHWKPEILGTPQRKLGALLRNARRKRGLSFRETSAMSRQIANFLGDEHYFASPGSLSDYETLDMPPRHIHKTITLCTVYGLEWSMLLKSVELPLENAGTEPMCDGLRDRPLPSGLGRKGADAKTPAAFLNHLLTDWENQVPLFLRGSLRVISGLSRISLHDVFWIGENQSPLPTTRNNSMLAIVNRRKKTPMHSRSRPLWQQPMYVLLRRNGEYGCEFCSLENGDLVLHSYIQGCHRSERLRNRHDAEVIGQVVTLARKLTFPVRD
jgi:transcriptional regulator with XRE-family HTH domain